MKKSHLFLGIFTSIIIIVVFAIGGKAFLQPLPPVPPPPQNSPLPIQKPSQELSLPSEKVTLPNPEALLDIAANLASEKYQNASCEDLSKMKPQSKKSAPTGGTPEAVLQTKAIEMLRQNPEIRKEFINRVAPPIANKMFDCKVIP
jgi:hypothetical protein